MVGDAGLAAGGREGVVPAPGGSAPNGGIREDCKPVAMYVWFDNQHETFGGKAKMRPVKIFDFGILQTIGNDCFFLF